MTWNERRQKWFMAEWAHKFVNFFEQQIMQRVQVQSLESRSTALDIITARASLEISLTMDLIKALQELERNWSFSTFSCS